ncbi:hypothetical protein [Nocardia rhizosphaerae]|uniref:Phage-related protein n=1 Tax=Nocardia rhizosphaerae TaxID=1691571 RepID=A0ABV8LB01_9NOCA
MASTAILAVRITGDGSGAQSAMRRTADTAKRMAATITAAGVAAVFVARNIGTISTVARYGGAAMSVLAGKALASSAALRFAANAAGKLARRAKLLGAALFAILPAPLRTALVKLGLALRLTGRAAAKAARDLGRLASAILVLRTVGRAVGAITRLWRTMGKLTLAAVPLLGALSAIATTAIAAGAAIGAALGAGIGGAVGTLAPALIAAKIGFSGLSRGAAEFNKQFAAANAELDKLVGQRMGPFLTAMDSMKRAVVDSFSAAMVPAFERLGSLVSTITPQMAGLGSTMGAMFSRIAEAVPTGAIQTMIETSRSFISALSPGIANLVGGLTQFGATASTVFARLGPEAGAALDSIGAKLAAITPEQIQGVFATISQTLTNIGNVLGPVVGLMAELGPIVSSSMAPAFAAVGAAITEASPALSNMAQVVFPALSQVIQNLAPIIPVLANAFTPWVTVLAAVAPLLASIAVAVAPMAPAILGIAIAVKAAMAAQALYNTVMLLYSNAGKIATAIQWAWNIAMSANPLAIVILAVIALIAVIVLIATKTTWFQTIWKAMAAAAVAAWNWIKDTALAIWNIIVTAVKTYIAVISAVISAVVSAIVGYWDFMASVWSAIWDGISAVASAVMSAIGSVISAAIDTAIGVFNTFKSIGEGAFNAVKTAIGFVGDAINTIIGFVQNLINAISNISFPSPPGWLSDLFGGAVGPQLVGVPGGAEVFRFLPPTPMTFGAAAPSLTAAAPSLGGVFASGSTAPPQITNINITVEGAIDPQAVGQQIKNILTGRDRTVGAAAAVDLRLGVA